MTGGNGDTRGGARAGADQGARDDTNGSAQYPDHRACTGTGGRAANFTVGMTGPATRQNNRGQSKD